MVIISPHLWLQRLARISRSAVYLRVRWRPLNGISLLTEFGGVPPTAVMTFPERTDVVLGRSRRDFGSVLFSVKPGRKIPTHDHSCIATLCMTIARAEHLRETDCVAEVVGLELRNVVAKYPFESSLRSPGSSRILATETIPL